MSLEGGESYQGIIDRELDRSTSTPTQEFQRLEGKTKQDYFLPQVPDSYHTEALRVIRVHGLKSNTSKNKHNWGQIIYLGI